MCIGKVADSIACFVRTKISRSSQGSIMSVMSIVDTTPALLAGQNDAKDMPSTMPFMCMASTTAAISIIFVRTGVLASVSLFVPTFVVATPLFVSLVVVLSLILISLTGLRGLVGLTVRLDLSASQGD